MTRLSALLIVAVPACSALLLGVRPSSAVLRTPMIVAEEDAPSFTAAETDALRAASISKEKCWEGAGCPADLQNIFMQPKVFYSLLRNPSEDPPMSTWDAVRKAYPVLASKSNEVRCASITRLSFLADVGLVSRRGRSSWRRSARSRPSTSTFASCEGSRRSSLRMFAEDAGRSRDFGRRVRTERDRASSLSLKRRRVRRINSLAVQ